MYDMFPLLKLPAAIGRKPRGSVIISKYSKYASAYSTAEVKISIFVKKRQKMMSFLNTLRILLKNAHVCSKRFAAFVGHSKNRLS